MGKFINDGLLSYNKGLASSGSGFIVSIFCEVEQLKIVKENKTINSMEFDFSILIIFT